MHEALLKALWVPTNHTGALPAKAFFSLTRLRNVEPGLHTIDRQAWQYCQSLRIVKLPATVVAVEHASFQGCYALPRLKTALGHSDQFQGAHVA